MLVRYQLKFLQHHRASNHESHGSQHPLLDGLASVMGQSWQCFEFAPKDPTSVVSPVAILLGYDQYPQYAQLHSCHAEH